MEVFLYYLIQRPYCENTTNIYSKLVRQFLLVLGKFDPSTLSEHNIVRYIQKYYLDKF